MISLQGNTELESGETPVNEQPGMEDIYRFLSSSMRYPAADWLNEDYFTALYTLLEGLAWHSDHDAQPEYLKQHVRGAARQGAHR